MSDDQSFPARLSDLRADGKDPASRAGRHLRSVRAVDLSHGLALQRVGARLARGEGLVRGRRRRRLLPWFVWTSCALAGTAWALMGLRGESGRGGPASEETSGEPAVGGGATDRSLEPRAPSPLEGAPVPAEPTTEEPTADVAGEQPGSPAPVQAVLAPPCDRFVPGTDLTLCSGTYIGGPGADEASAVRIAADGVVVWAGALSEAPALDPARTLLAPGSGAVVRLGASGREVRSFTRLGERIHDMELDSRDRIVVVGVPFGLAVLSPDGARIVWRHAVHGQRVAVASDGTIAVLGHGGLVSVIDADGSTLGVFGLGSDLGGAVASDVALDARTRTIVVTGHLRGPPDQPFVRALSYDGQLRWHNWGGSISEARARRLTASTQGTRVTIGGDGHLYYLGWSSGANTSHLFDPRQPQQRLSPVVLDPYTDPVLVANYAVMFVARLSIEDGAVEASQFHLARSDLDGKGRSLHPEALAVDEAGRVLIGGYQICCMEGQAQKTVNGVSLKKAGVRDAFVLMMSPDFRQRLLWTTFGGGRRSVTTSVAIRAGLVTMTAGQERTSDPRPMVTTPWALEPQPPGGSDAYLAVWPAP